MLELRPNCECCDAALPGDSLDAFICSFECTYCRECAQERLQGRCPNCQGMLAARPARVGKSLAEHPASSLRVSKVHTACS
ncbi:DUF1272 domain-containing protein [Pseudomonas sp. SGAir0191]|uniref:DUF1272 domain-containing protein n=1 Tax=Pseudomonas TaxID=286 RepID=UPI0009BDD840|nr:MULTISPECIES: DUF1272 domain-containing protein [Pseudomonas]AUA32895.1 DUF1272 domain-containing protein [Pseudomonas sp. SGAir0191]